MDSATATSPTSSDVMTEWRVGQLVSVEPRTGPGMNQPGGVARITRINADTTCPDRPGAKAPLVQISVKYVVSGNHEKNLESRYVQRHEWEATLRDRTHNSGRCRNCGSLRKDCGFCDELYGVPEDSMLGPSLHQRLPQRRLSSSLPTNMAADLCSSKRQDLSDESNSSEDESVYLKTMIAQNKRNYRKYIKLKARADKFYGKENLGLESPHSKQSTGVQAEARRLGKHQTKLTRNGLVDMRNSETSTSDDENHHYSAATWRAGTNLQSSRRSEQTCRHRTRRLNHTKSVLESHVQSDSDSDSDENVALAALKRLDKAAVPNRDLPSSSRSVASSISNPGSAESDSDSISPIPRRSVSAISRNMNGHEITHGPETESDGPEAESDHDGFIQPEGEVDRLPADVFDETLNLEYPALIPFFNKTIERLKKVDIPQAQQQAGELKQEWKDCSDDINPDHRQRQEKREALQRKSEMLFDTLKRILVQNGTDQCQNALRKLTNRSFYRRYKKKNGGKASDAPCIRFVDHDDNLEFEYDDMKERVDGLMREVRNMAKSNDCDRSAASLDESDSDGWVEPESQSPPRYNDDSESNEIEHRHQALEPQPNEMIDPHPFASKKRKKGARNIRDPAFTKRRKRSMRKQVTTSKSFVGDTGTFQDANCNGPTDSDSSSLDQLRRSRVPHQKHRRQPSSTNRFDTAGKSNRNGLSKSSRACDRIESTDESFAGHDDVSFSHGGDDPSSAAQGRLLDKPISDRTKTANSTKHRQADRRMRSERGNNNSTSSRQNSRKAQQTTRSDLFSLLTVNASTNLPLGAAPDLPDLRRAISETSGDSTRGKVLKSICNTIERSDWEADAAVGFQTLLDFLLSSGGRTLQDLISSESPALGSVVDALVATLRLLRIGVNKTLSPSDGTLFLLFGQDRSSSFLDFVTLQFTDSVMSLLQPDAWSIGESDRQAVFSKLGALRDELARHSCLLETVCNCLMRVQELQQWRCVRDGDNIFVSAVDPDSWHAYLSLGTEPRKPTSARFMAFGDCLPRCEVEAVWCHIAFCALAPSRIDTSEMIRWQFLSSLLTKGSLSQSADSDLLPPPKEQLDAAEADLTSLADLIAVGSMGSIPRRDNVLITILQRSIMLQSEALLLDDASLTEYRRASTRSRIPLGGLQSVRTTISCLEETLLASRTEAKWAEQPVLLPSSGILGCCLRLMVVWKKHIGSDKRYHCFENATKALVKSLTSTSRRTTSDSKPCGRDPFGEAFSSRSEESDRASPESSQDLFKRESAAYVSIFASRALLRESSASSEKEFFALCSCVWALLADDSMRQRPATVDSESQRPFAGDIAHVCVAAKAMTLLALSLLGMTPPIDADGLTVTECTDVATANGGINAFRFLLSCLASCLDCASLSTQRDPESIILILNHIRIILVVAREKNRRVYCDCIAKYVCNTRVLQDCFHGLLRTSVGVSQGDSYLKIFTEVVQVLIAIEPFQTEERAGTQIASMQDRQADCNSTGSSMGAFVEDGVDVDACLATVLGKFLSSMYVSLTNAIEACRPSSRNGVAQGDGNHIAEAMSVQGMQLISKQSDRVCLLLADMVACPWYVDPSSVSLCDTDTRFNATNDQGDTRYYKRVAQSFTRHICGQYVNENVISVARRSKEAILFNLVECLLDVDLLSKVPSCNLTRIESSSGASGEEKGFAEWKSYQDGKLESLTAQITVLRQLSSDVGNLVLAVNANESRESNDWLGELLRGFSVQSERHPTSLSPSLELECFHRLALLRDLLTRLSLNVDSWTSFERLSCFILASCSSETARLLRKISLQDRAHEGVVCESYKKAKLYETFTSYAELYISLVATIFRIASRCHCSDSFRELLARVIGDFIVEIMLEQDFMLLNALNTVCALAAALLQETPLPHSRSEPFAASFDAKPYRGVFRDGMERRMRDIVMFAAANLDSLPISSVSNLLTTTFACQKAGFVRRCFGSTIGDASDALDDPKHASPIVAAIENEFASTELSEPGSTDQIAAIGALRRFAMQHVLTHKILDDKQCSSTRLNMLRIASSLLETESDSANRLGCPTMSPVTLCSLAKGIAACVLHALSTEREVNEAFVSASFACARTLIVIPASCIKNTAVGCLIDWICEVRDKASEEMSPEVVHARYLYCFCKWLVGVGNLIVENQVERINAFRSELLSKKHHPGTDWPSVSLLSDDKAISDQMRDLEARVFPVARLANGKAITNVYAASVRTKRAVEATTSISSSNDDGLVEWHPSTALISVVLDFKTKAAYGYVQ